MKGSRSAILTAALVLASACGAAPWGGGPAASPAPSAVTADLPPNLVAVDGSPQQVSRVRLDVMDARGMRVAMLQIPDFAVPLGTGGRYVFVASNGRLLRVSAPNWTPEDVGTARAANPRSFAASPDGGSWVWAEVDSSNSDWLTSRLVLSAPGRPDRVIASTTQQLRVLRPYRWTQAGLVVAHQPVGIGGYILFDAPLSATELMDPDSGRSKPLTTAACQFADISSAGSVACFDLGDQSGAALTRTIRVQRPDGAVKLELRLPLPSFNQVGVAYFEPGAESLVVGGSEGNGLSGERQERYHLIRVEPAGAWRAFGPQDVIPVPGFSPWLQGGVLAVQRPDGTPGGRALLLLGPGGAAVTAATSGLPLGTLAA